MVGVRHGDCNLRANPITRSGVTGCSPGNREWDDNSAVSAIRIQYGWMCVQTIANLVTPCSHHLMQAGARRTTGRETEIRSRTPPLLGGLVAHQLADRGQIYGMERLSFRSSRMVSRPRAAPDKEPPFRL